MFRKIGRFEIKLIDLTGKKYENWYVICRGDNKTRPNGSRYTTWLCECICGTRKEIEGSELRRGGSKSCGCLASQLSSERNTKLNTYDLSGEYGIGYTSDGLEFYFDLEDYDLIKDYYWRINDSGYISNYLMRMMHRYIMNCPENFDVDHINPITKNDNRKSNLQICTTSQNIMKKSIMKNNSSGITGVSWSNTKNKWLVRLYKDKKCIYLKYIANKEEAIKSRLEAENKYFGEYAPQKHLYEQYGIN